MFNELRYAYLNHKSRVSLLSRIEYLNPLHKGVKSIFELLVIFNILLSVMLFATIGIFSILNLVILFLLVPVYYNFIKLLVYSIIWASKHLEIRVQEFSELDG